MSTIELNYHGETTGTELRDWLLEHVDENPRAPVAAPIEGWIEVLAAERRTTVERIRERMESVYDDGAITLEGRMHLDDILDEEADRE